MPERRHHPARLYCLYPAAAAGDPDGIDVSDEAAHLPRYRRKLDGVFSSRWLHQYRRGLHVTSGYCSPNTSLLAKTDFSLHLDGSAISSSSTRRFTGRSTTQAEVDVPIEAIILAVRR